MRLATWNIRAGGGKRIEPIAEVILEESPDVLVLTEYRPAPGKALFERLSPLSYRALAGVASGLQNCVCVLSRHELEPFRPTLLPKSSHRWVSARIPALDLILLGVHVPNQFEVWNKREFWDCVSAYADETRAQRSIILGDLNTALDEDCEGEPIREAVHFKSLLDAGWVDAWRQRNPTAREFSWYSHRANGFRLDHCLVSPSLAETVKSSSYRHDVRTEGLSDHSMLHVNLDLSVQQEAHTFDDFLTEYPIKL